jgi:hypothetical protein
MATQRIRQTAPLSSQSSVAQTLTDWLVARACKGVAPFESAAALAAPYLKPGAYKSPEAAARALVQHEMGKTFGAGFVTGLGGFVALPVALPAGMAMSLLLQARMVAAIAILFGHDPEHPGVHTSILLSLEAGFAPEGVRRVGAKLGKWAAARTLNKIAPDALVQINERVGANLLRRVGRNKWGVFGRAVPVVGAMVAGGMDAYGCRQVARQAIELFSRSASEQALDEDID